MRLDGRRRNEEAAPRPAVARWGERLGGGRDGEAAQLVLLRGVRLDECAGGLGADGLGASRDGAEARFGREIVLQWMAEEAKTAATSRDRGRLASANELWEKANALLEDTDEYNLDARQTLVAIFDAIKRHAQSHLAVPEHS